MYDPSTMIKYVIPAHFFHSSLVGIGSRKHQKIVEKITTEELRGCFALTEVNNLCFYEIFTILLGRSWNERETAQNHRDVRPQVSRVHSSYTRFRSREMLGRELGMQLHTRHRFRPTVYARRRLSWASRFRDPFTRSADDATLSRSGDRRHGREIRPRRG